MNFFLKLDRSHADTKVAHDRGYFVNHSLGLVLETHWSRGRFGCKILHGKVGPRSGSHADSESLGTCDDRLPAISS